MTARAHGWRSVADGLAVGERRAGACCEDLAAVGRPWAAVPRSAVRGRRWRDLVGDGLLFAALAMVFPASILLYVGVGQAVAVGAIAGALALMMAGWVIGRE